MKALAEAVLRTGLIDPAAVMELRRWGVPLDDFPPAKPHSLEEVATKIHEAIESEDYVLIRETDLLVLEQYLATARPGTLHVVAYDGEGELRQSDVPVAFGKTPLDGYIFAWTSEGIADLLTNGMTYLLDAGKKVYFGQVRELFYGETKAFIICSPAHIEEAPRTNRDVT